jgi:hypothetical protein
VASTAEVIAGSRAGIVILYHSGLTNFSNYRHPPALLSYYSNYFPLLPLHRFSALFTCYAETATLTPLKINW